MTTVRDCNGAILGDGDTVQVIKDLKVKGTSASFNGTTRSRVSI